MFLFNKDTLEIDSESSESSGRETEAYVVPANLSCPKIVTRNPELPLKRKKQRNTSQWKSVKAKKAKISGTAGTCKVGKPISEQSFACRTKINIDQRKAIHNEFWKLKDHTRQWDYVSRHMQRYG